MRNIVDRLIVWTTYNGAEYNVAREGALIHQLLEGKRRDDGTHRESTLFNILMSWRFACPPAVHPSS